MKTDQNFIRYFCHTFFGCWMPTLVNLVHYLVGTFSCLIKKNKICNEIFLLIRGSLRS